jgi:hypothetical protein
MSDKADRLYELLPAVYRLRDADRGYPLRALLQVIAEQVNVVDGDIAGLYDNWFIETCRDWVVPYIGDLIGYTPVFDTGEPADVATPRALARERILIPRREVANTVRYRRRKGTLAVLEELAEAVAGWPARAVEVYRLLSYTQNINYLHLDRGRTVDLRDGDALDELDGPFDEVAHTADVRSVNAKHFPGFGNIPDVDVFVWRLKTYSITQAPAYCLEEEGPNCFLFSVLGNDTQLFNHVQPTVCHPPGKLNLPNRISRRDLQNYEISEQSETTASGVPYYYSEDKSFQIWVGPAPRQPVPAEQIVPADLSDWRYRPLPSQVAVDPVLGRIAFPPGSARRQPVWVSYYYGFSADIGGGEYNRPLSQPAAYNLYLVGEQENFARINDALIQWRNDAPANAVIEITDSGVYVEPINITLTAGQSLQLRAANRKRPVIRLLNWQTSLPDSLSVTGDAGSWFTLDGLVVTGRGIQVGGDVAGVTIRHSTLVPGWGLTCDCEPRRSTEPSIELDDAPGCLTIEHSIVGSIVVNRDEVNEDPCSIRVSDSMVDATSDARVAVGAPESLCAYAVLSIKRSTVFGEVQTQAIELAENCIFMGSIHVCRRQQGCMRFCYVTPGSRTPRRYECQPDLVENAVRALFNHGDLSLAERDSWLASEQLRVEPEFNSTRYGTPTYCQLTHTCAEEITRGADDKAEMGVFHDLYQSQRTANLRVRLDEYTPAGMNAGILYAS